MPDEISLLENSGHELMSCKVSIQICQQKCAVVFFAKHICYYLKKRSNNKGFKNII